MTFFKLYARNIRQIPRIPTVLVFGIMMPVIQLALFGSIFSETTNLPGHPYQGENYYRFIAPAIVLLTCFLGMANASAAFLSDLRTGYFDKLRTTRANPGMVIVARLCAEMTRVAAQATLILVIAYALGARIETGILGAAVMVVFAVLFSAVTTGLLTTMLAMKTKSDQATQSAFPLFFVFIFLSTAYMPANQLPGWLQTVVKYNPVDYLIQAFRSLTFDGWSVAAGNLGLAAIFGAVLALLLGFANFRAYKKMIG
ncbi:MAG: ABC transporter permease [Thermoplasmatota archaeon]